METLFRLTLNRPPIAQDENSPSLELKQETQFQADLGQAQQAGQPREALKAVARQFMESPEFVGSPGDVPLFAQLKKLKTALDALESRSNFTHNDVHLAIKDAFGSDADPVVALADFKKARTSLRDSLVAIKLLPEEHSRPVAELTNQLRELEFIQKVADVNNFPNTAAGLRRFRRSSLKLPSQADLRSALSTSEKQKELDKQHQQAQVEKRRNAETKLGVYKLLTTAIDELMKLSSNHLQSTPQRPDAGFQAPENVRPLQVLIRDIGDRQQRSKLHLQRAEGVLGTEGNTELALDRAFLNLRATDQIVEPTSPKAGLIRGSGTFAPLNLAEVSFRLKPSVAESVSANTAALLQQRGLTFADHSLDHIVEALRTETLELSKELDSLFGRPVQRSIKRVGKSMVMISTPLASVWNNMVISNDLVFPGYVFPIDNRVPNSHGNVAPAGVADLLVVKQQLVRYEATDVAHIENVLKGEKKDREHSRRRETEEFTLRETEITTTEERELESTTRFEMSRETSQTIREDATLKAGLTVSGKYGPSVEFSASAEGSVSRSKEEATKAASSFSQDVTERSAYKVTERVLERSSLRVTNEVIEKNTHTLDNVKGSRHISGVYQWVNKVYQAQMFNYGIRMMYDFMVPEPAAFLISTMLGAHTSATTLVKPTDFSLRPDQITETNYHGWVKEYGATDVQPPPDLYKTKSHDYNANAEDKNVEFTHSAQIAIEDGYRAVYGTIGCVRTIWEPTANVDVILGSRSHRFTGGDWVWSTSLGDETDSIPLALVTDLVGDVAIAVEIKCQRTDRAMLKWRLDTHAKLTTAYKARLAEYEEKLAALEVQAGVAIQGRNPFLNLELMNDELKKHCTTIMTEQHFDLFNAIQVGSHNVPQVDLFENAAEGPYVRFFEQAFEWEQMTWLTYPYFWGNKSSWDERIGYEDVDPIFNQFLKSGYCRAVVPVRPGFEGAIDHFMTYGEIWAGGPLPVISNPLYLPIADEIAERLDRPGEEIPQGDPWLVRIPTSLVHLRDDDKLPKWRQDANGEWVEA